MQIDRILYPVTTLGPGDRLVIWTIGCPRRCHKCANPELWHENPDKNVAVVDLAKMIRQAVGENKIDGITITGGDPFAQIRELNELLLYFTEFTHDILVYTGYTAGEAKSVLPEGEWEKARKNISVLIDGAYTDSLNDNKCTLRGSSNQNIIFFDDSKKAKYTEYLEKGRSVQNVFYNNKMISVGIHNREIE
jgi:anaerobic ribonucleoside-triphosphate reductase activating protein